MTKYTEVNSNFGQWTLLPHHSRRTESLVDGDDYFDMLADDVIVEYVISVPGYPKRVKGRKRVINLYSDYDSYMSVQSADNLRFITIPKLQWPFWNMSPWQISSGWPSLRQSLRFHRHD